MATKPTRVRYSGAAPFIDDTQVNRVQALGSSSRLTTEDIKEVGTLNITEIIDDVPQVDVSIDQNENGTLDLLGLFSNKGYGCNVVAVPASGSATSIGSNQIKVRQGSYIVNGNRIVFNSGNSYTTTVVNASGSAQYVYLNPTPTGGGVAQVGVATSVPAGSIQIATLAGASIGSGNIRQVDITDNRTFGTVGHLDFELARVDVAVPVKQTTNATTIDRTMYMEKVFVNSADFSFQANGVATASFKAETDNKRWFLNSNSQVITDQFKAASAVTTVTLTQTPSVLANGNYTLKLIKNGIQLTEGTGKDYTVSGTTVTFTSALAIGDLIKVRYCAASGGQAFAPYPATENPHPELAGGLREGHVEIYLSDNLTSRLTRVKSARISVPLPREQLDEIGAMGPYDRPLQLPITNTIALEFVDSDLEVMARLSGYNLATVNEISVLDLLKNMGLTIKLYRENDVKRTKLPSGHPDKYVIKTITINNLIPQNENWDVRVDSDASQTFDFQAHNISFTDVVAVGSI